MLQSLIQAKTLDFFTGLDTFVTLHQKVCSRQTKPGRHGGWSCGSMVSMPSDEEMCSKVLFQAKTTFSRDLTLSSRSPSKSMQQTKQAWTSWWMVMRCLPVVSMPSDEEMCSKVLFQAKTLDFFTGLDTFVTISIKKYAADKPSLDVMVDDHAVLLMPHLLCRCLPMRRCAPKSYSKRKFSTFSRDSTLSSRSPSKSMQQTNQAWASWWMVMYGSIDASFVVSMPSDEEMCSKVLFQAKTLDFFTGLDTFVTISIKKYAADKPSLGVMVDDHAVLSMPRLLCRCLPMRRCAPKSYSKRKLSTFSRDLTLSSSSPSKSMQQTNQAWTSWWMIMRFY